MKVNSVVSLGSVIALLACNAAVEAAPAPLVVTVTQVATQVTNDDGSLYTSIDGATTATTVAAASTTATAAATTTSATATSTSTSSKFSLSSFLNSDTVKLWLSKLSGSSTSSSASSTSTSTSTATHGFLYNLLHDFEDEADDSTTSAAATTSATATATATATSSKTSSTALTAKTTSSADSTETTATSTSSGDVYAAISQCSDIDESFASDTLDAHNKYRALHGVGDLSWDVDTYNYAKNNADNYDCSGVLTHTHGQYGENLAAGYSSGPSSVKAWYDEGESYDYSSANTYDHFTQVVWKSTTKVGCAYKDCSSEGWGLYVICEYDPAGNVIGEDSENVLALVSS